MKSHSIISSTLGNIIEWYDFGLFAIFSSLLSVLFFPDADRQTNIMATFGVFAIGFFCRPLGALIFGYYGDTIGRAKTLRFSILMISLPTLLIGVLPTYQTIGMAAPFLLTAIRMWQGISIGGEYSGNLIYLAESAPKKHRALLTALAGTGANAGILLASLMGMLTSAAFSTKIFYLWGWCIPFLFSGVFSIFIYYTRLQMQETPVFNHLQKNNRLVKNPIKTIFTKNMSNLFVTLGLVCMGSSFYYFCFVYMPLLLTINHDLSIKRMSLIMTFFMILMILLVPTAGLLCDRFGRRKMLLINATFITLSVIPGFYFLNLSYFFPLFATLLLFTVLSSSEQATTSIAVVENFPAAARYTGLSVGYNLGNGFIGGSVPIVCAWLYSHAFRLAPACYIAICAMITGLVVFFYVPETKGESLM